MIPLRTSLRRVFNQEWLSGIYLRARRIARDGTGERTRSVGSSGTGTDSTASAADDDFEIQTQQEIMAAQQEIGDTFTISGRRYRGGLPSGRGCGHSGRNAHVRAGTNAGNRTEAGRGSTSAGRAYTVSYRGRDAGGRRGIGRHRAGSGRHFHRICPLPQTGPCRWNPSR